MNDDKDLPKDHESEDAEARPDASEVARDSGGAEEAKAGAGEEAAPEAGLPPEVLGRWAGLPEGQGAEEGPTKPGEPCPPTPASRGGRNWLVIVGLVIALLALAGVAAKTFTDLGAANQALTVAVNTMAAASGAASNPQRVSATVANIGKRNYGQVVRDLQTMASQVASGPAPTPQTPAGLGSLLPGQGPEQPAPTQNVPGPLAAQLGPDATKFFNTHPKLLEQLLELAAGARQIEKKGVDVSSLRPIRDQAIKAAAAGDAATVRKLIGEFNQKLQALGGQAGPPPPSPSGHGQQTQPQSPPPALLAKVAKLKTTLEAAARQHKDIRQAVRLAQEADQAASSGDMPKAEELLDAALRAAQHAPVMQGPPRGARRRLRQPTAEQRQPGPPIARAMDIVMGMLRAEESDLSKTYDAIENAQIALREKNQKQINTLLDEAKQSLEHIAKRRRQVSLALHGAPPPGARRPGGAGGPAAAGGAGPRVPGAPGGMTNVPLPERLAAFLEVVRKMPQSEFDAAKDQLAAIVFSMFLPPQHQEPKPAATAQQLDAVRHKLLLAAGPYLQRKLAGYDVSGLDSLFRQARTALYSGKVATANKLVDEALGQLGLLTPSEASAAGLGASALEGGTPSAGPSPKATAGGSGMPKKAGEAPAPALAPSPAPARKSKTAAPAATGK